MHKRQAARVLLFTGVLRHQEMFEEQLESLRDLECLDRKILCTWTEDYETNKAIFDFYTLNYGLEVIHKRPPPFVHGHFLHQMSSLENGLAQLNDNDVVLKTRTDLVFSRATVEYVLTKDRMISGPGLHEPLTIASCIDIVEAQLISPFFFDDIAFCGVVSDLKRFVNMEMKFELVYKSYSFIHERYWGAFFDSHFAFLQDYYKQSWFLGGDTGLRWALLIGNDYRRQMIHFAIRDRDYGRMMALSFLITHQMFSMDWGPDMGLFRFSGTWGKSTGPRWGGTSFEADATLSEVFSAKNISRPDGSLSAASDQFFSRLVNGRFDECPIGRNIGRGLAEVKAASFRDLQTLADMKAFSARAVRQSKDVVQSLLPRFHKMAHELAKAGKTDAAEILLNGLVNHLAA